MNNVCSSIVLMCLSLLTCDLVRFCFSQRSVGDVNVLNIVAVDNWLVTQDQCSEWTTASAKLIYYCIQYYTWILLIDYLCVYCTTKHLHLCARRIVRTVFCIEFISIVTDEILRQNIMNVTIWMKTFYIIIVRIRPCYIASCSEYWYFLCSITLVFKYN